MASDKIKIALEQDTNARPIEISVLQDDCPVISATVLTGYSSDVPGDIVARLDYIESLIPAEATPDNQLADKEYVDTAIAGVDSTVSALAQNVAENTSDIAGIKAQQTADKNDIAQLQSNVAANTGAISALESSVEDVQAVIPSQASAENPLADKAFVNSTVQTSTANFRGNWPTYADIPTIPTAYPVDFAGSTTPTPNDYLVVEADENYDGQTWRYKYIGDWATQGKSGWRAEYKVNDTPLTAGQLAALNSGATAENIAQIATNKSDISTLSATKADKSAIADMLTATDAAELYETQAAASSAHDSINEKIDAKQDKLTAGENITIENNVISASGGVPDNVVINNTTSDNGLAIGGTAKSSGGYGQIAIGTGAEASGNGGYGIAIGVGAKTGYITNTAYGIAIGNNATVMARNAIQIGPGNNSVAYTLNIGLQSGVNYTLLTSAGLIPSARFAAGGTDGQVLVKNGETAEWKDMGGGSESGLPDQTGHTGYLQTDGINASWSDVYPLVNQTTMANSIAIGNADTKTASTWSIAIGGGATTTGQYNIALGTNATAVGNSVAIGFNAKTQASGIAIGVRATLSATAKGSCLINGSTSTQTLTTPNTLAFANTNGLYTIIQEDGTIPAERLAADGSEGQVLTKTSDGVEWQAVGGVSYADLQQVQTDLQNAINAKADASAITDMLTKTEAAGIYQTQATATATDNAQDEKITANTSAISALTGRVSANETNITTLTSNVDNVQGLIPTQASDTNQLADKAFVNSTIQTATANFRGNWATHADIPSDVSSYPEDYAGNRTPTVNDYLVVEADETHGGATWRYKYTGNWTDQGVSGWVAEYKVNDTPLTAAQLSAVNSGITAEYVGQIDTNRNDISEALGQIAALDTDKQDKLTAGTGIGISEENVVAVENPLPALAGNSGFLTTDGTTASWSGVAAATKTDISDMLTRTNAAQTYLTQADAKTTYVNTVQYEQTQNAVTALQTGKQDKLTAGDNITIENNVISATGGGSGVGRNVGDVFYTARLDNELSGAVEANGIRYNLSDINGGNNNLQDLLTRGAIPYVSLAQHAADIEQYGSCRAFGWDGGDVIAVPKIAGRYLVRKKEATAADPTGYEIYSDGWCEQWGINAGTVSSGVSTNDLLIQMRDTAYEVYMSRIVVGTADDAASISLQARNLTTTSFQGRQTYATSNGGGVGSGASYRYNWTVKGYADPSEYTQDKWNVADIQANRAMVQLFNGATDNAIATATGVLADVAELKNMMGLVSGRILVRKKEPTAADPTWYEIYSDGKCVQGGVNPTASGANVLINLAIKQRDVNYNVSLGRRNANAYAESTNNASLNQATRMGTTYNRATTTSFYVSYADQGNTGGGAVYWQVDGYADPSEYAQDKWNVRPSANGLLWLPTAPTANGDYSLGLIMKNGEPTPYWGQTFVQPPSAPQRYLVRKKEPTVNDRSWYEIYSDGKCVQGGRVTLNGTISSSNKQVDYPIKMRDVAYYINVTQDANAGGTPRVLVGYQSTTKCNVGFVASGGTNGSVSWLIEGYADPSEYTTDKWGDDTDYSTISVMTGDPSPFKFKAWTNAGGETVYTLLAVPIARGDDMYTEDQLAVYNEWDANQSTAPLPKVEDRCGALGVVNGNRAINGGGEQMGTPGELDATTAYVRNQALDTNG